MRNGPGHGPSLAEIALLGSLIGLYLAIRGVGPSTVPDLAFHVGIVATLVVGVIATARLTASAEM